MSSYDASNWFAYVPSNKAFCWSWPVWHSNCCCLVLMNYFLAVWEVTCFSKAVCEIMISYCEVQLQVTLSICVCCIVHSGVHKCLKKVTSHIQVASLEWLIYYNITLLLEICSNLVMCVKAATGHTEHYGENGGHLYIAALDILLLLWLRVLSTLYFLLRPLPMAMFFPYIRY